MTEHNKIIDSDSGNSKYKVEFKLWLDELLSDEDEAKYRSWTFEKDLKLMRGLAKIGLTLTFILIIIGLFIEININGQYTMIARVIMLFFFLSVHHFLKKTLIIEEANLIMLYSIIGTICTELLVVLSFPVSYFTHVGFDITIIFISYLAIPISLRNKIIICFFYSLALSLILFLYKEPVHLETYGSFLTSIIFANVIAYWIAIQLGRSRRLNYQHLINERKVRDEIRQLQGIISICSYCKNIRDDGGTWARLEAYISANSDAKFSHGICPTCLPDVLEKSRRKT